MSRQTRTRREAAVELPRGPGSQLVAETNSPTVRAAIVYGRETAAMADAVEALLGSTAEFSCARCEYRGEAGSGARRCNTIAGEGSDLVVAAVGREEAQTLPSFFHWIQQTFPDCSVVAVPVDLSTADIVAMLEAGASDFVLPPLRALEVLPRLRRQARLSRRGDVAVQKLKQEIGLKQFIGESPSFLSAVQRLPRYANCDASVVISGESGTGKEIFARALHYLSPRADHPFVPINCGALPEHLVESEIFGHKRGAFTGAAADQAGLIEEAQGGTVFLDELDALTRPAQVKLLRFLQDGEYRPVGGQKVLHADVRVIAATNADFGTLIRAGKFREDLFYRLNVLTLTLPPLRERRGDILLLADHFLAQEAARTEGRRKNLSLPALQWLLGHSWPGNVRELENLLKRATVLSDGDTIELPDLGLGGGASAADEQSFQTMKSRVVSRFEHDFLQSALAAHGGNITRAAGAVKKNRRAFWELLRKHGLVESAQPDESVDK